MDNQKVLKDAISQVEVDFTTIQGKWKDFKVRDGQNEMVRQCIRTFSNALASSVETEHRRGQNIAVVQASTGVGKSLAYLVPGLRLGQALDKTLVISTATVALQEQLFHRDIPRVLDALNLKITVAMAKGRGRYLCLSRAQRLVGESSQTTFLEDAIRQDKLDQKDLSEVRVLLERYGQKQWDGDSDNLKDSKPDYKLWSKLNADSSMCLGRSCSNYSKCAMYRARAELSEAKVIVINHDMLLSLKESESRIIPNLQEALVVCDEGHHLPDIALKRSAIEVPIENFRVEISRSGLLINQSAVHFGVGREHLTEVSGITRTINTVMGDLLDYLRAQESLNRAQTGTQVLRFAHGLLGDQVRDVLNELTVPVEKYLEIVRSLAESFGEVSEASGGNPVGVELIAELGLLISRIEQLHSCCTEMQRMRQVPLAKWFSATRSQGHIEPFYKMHVSALSGAKVLINSLWRGVGASVVCSATISSCGNFDYFAKRSGLNRFPQTEYISVSSPFDYAVQGVCWVPSKGFNPKVGVEHTQEVVRTIEQWADRLKGGMLVIFASRKQMQEVFSKLSPGIAALVLSQDGRSRVQILADHSARVQKGQRSVLFGLQGFGEGLDLPGALCEKVLIAKLPFDPPDSPTEEALAEWLESQDRNPFMELVVPKASIKLNQWSGRLIRTESDKGEIGILDSRLYSARYGKLLLDSLPAFTMNRLRPS